MIQRYFKNTNPSSIPKYVLTLQFAVLRQEQQHWYQIQQFTATIYIIYIIYIYILYQCEKHLWYKWIVYHSVPWTIISIIVHVLHSNGKNFSAQWLAGSEQLQVLFQARVLTFQLFNLLHLGSGCFSMNPPWTPHGATKQQVLLAASNGFNGCCKDWPLADFQT